MGQGARGIDFGISYLNVIFEFLGLKKKKKKKKEAKKWNPQIKGKKKKEKEKKACQ